MNEFDFFGVQDPISDNIGFVSVMGGLGEHFAIGIYPGAKGLQAFRSMQASMNDAAGRAQEFLSTAQLQLSFETKSMLERADIQQIKALGLKYSGKSGWPMFRSYRPSFYPWLLEEEEMQVMLHALEQALIVFQDLTRNPSLLSSLAADYYLIRTPIEKNEGIVWENLVKLVLPSSDSLAVVTQIPSLSRLQQVKNRVGRIEMDFRLFTTPVREGSNRPFFPHLLMAIDAEGGFVLGVEMLSPIPSHELMWGSVAEKLCSWLVKMNVVPEEVAVRSDLLQGVLTPLAQGTGIRLVNAKSLPCLDEAMADLLKSMPRNGP